MKDPIGLTTVLISVSFDRTTHSINSTAQKKMIGGSD